MKNVSRVAPLVLVVLGTGCTGDTGAAGANALVSVSAEDPSESCPAGGLRVDTGLDDGAGGETAGDGVLGPGEIDATEYVCNGDPGDQGETGEDGADGADGANGADGAEALVAVTDEPGGANCAAGGKRIDTGLDNGDGGETAGDGILGAGEIDATSYVCHGEDGADGQDGTDGTSSLISITDEPAGANCPIGGQRIDTGLDDGDGGETAGDGILGAGEIDATDYVCAAVAPSWPAAEGILQNVSLSAFEAAGWTVCHQDTYADGLDAAAVKAGCQGDYMMLACREGATDTLTLAAADTRAVVTQVDPATATAFHESNGVGWYYSDGFSWGFFPASESVNRSSCDFNGTLPEQRLCWHTRDDQGGWRCGATQNLNNAPSWQRLVLVK